MPSSGGVYQPTTTGLPNKSWSSASPRFLGPGGSTTGSRFWPKSMVLVLAGFFAVMGLTMVIVGSKWKHDVDASNVAAKLSLDNYGGTIPPPPPIVSAAPFITILVVGLLLMVVAVVGLVAYYRSLGVGMPCCPGKIAHIRQHLQTQHKFPSGAPICAQYCPPSTSPSSLSPSSPPSISTTTTTLQPHSNGDTEPPFADVSEQQRLMSDDTERMLDDDPRIVLTPLKSHEDC